MLMLKEYTAKILNACMEVHNELGNGFLVNFGENSLKWQRITMFKEEALADSNPCDNRIEEK